MTKKEALAQLARVIARNPKFGEREIIVTETDDGLCFMLKWSGIAQVDSDVDGRAALTDLIGYVQD